MIDSAGTCIHVHVQKTAGKSINQALGLKRIMSDGGEAPNHLFAHEIRDLVGEQAWDAAFSFAFVRNPWDRLVSWWLMIDQNPRPTNPWWRYVTERGPTFRDAVLHCVDEVTWEVNGVSCHRSFRRNQLDYLVDENGDVIVDMIGRFESLSADLAKVCRAIGRPVPELPHHRHGTRRDRHYSTFYDAELRDLVGEIYADDVKTFGYSFEHPDH